VDCILFGGLDDLFFDILVDWGFDGTHESSSCPSGKIGKSSVADHIPMLIP
jgi:hypothetical protein